MPPSRQWVQLALALLPTAQDALRVGQRAHLVAEAHPAARAARGVTGMPW